MDATQAAWLGVAGALAATLVGVLATFIWQHITERRRREEAAHFQVYSLLLALNEQYFWVASATLHGKQPDPEVLDRCFAISRQVVEAIRRTDSIRHVEEIVTVLFDITLPNANDRANRLGGLVDRYSRLVNPRLSKAMGHVSDANILAQGPNATTPESWAPGQVHLEMARSDWTPLARQFQEGLLYRIFRGEPYQAFVMDYVQATLAGEKDDLLVYRKRLRHRLDAYQVNVPPQVRAARVADAYNESLKRPMQYQEGGWIQYVMTRNGPEPLETLETAGTNPSRIDYAHYLTKQLEPIADAMLQPMGDSFVALTNAQRGLF